MPFSKDFLWGTAECAGQNEGGYNEGGKGLTTLDVMTLGTKEVKRKITEGILENEIYPSRKGSDFYHQYKVIH